MREYWIDISTLDYAVYFFNHEPKNQRGNLFGPFKNRTEAKKEASKIMRQYLKEYKAMLSDIKNCNESDFQKEEL